MKNNTYPQRPETLAYIYIYCMYVYIYIDRSQVTTYIHHQLQPQCIYDTYAYNIYIYIYIHTYIHIRIYIYNYIYIFIHHKVYHFWTLAGCAARPRPRFWPRFRRWWWFAPHRLVALGPQRPQVVREVSAQEQKHLVLMGFWLDFD